MLADLLSKPFAADLEECWEREWTSTPVRVFAVRLHAPGYSLREIASILAELDIERSHQAIFQWLHRLADSISDPPIARPSRVAVDETAVRIYEEWSWLYATIDINTKLLLDVQLFKRHGTDLTAAFLHRIVEKHDCSETIFLVDTSEIGLHFLD